MARKYSIEKYSENWKRRFRSQERLLKKTLGSSALEIHHIGSTSIRGMSAKPIVDILVVVKDFSAIDRAKAKFEKLGYVFRSNYVKPNSRLLEKFHDETKLYNIHFFKKNHEHAIRFMNVRDYLRSHPAAVKEYEALKRSLKRQFPNDYRSYSNGKDKFVDNLAKKAKSWRNRGERLEKEGFKHIYEWSDKPNTKYPAHKHRGKVVLYITDGDLSFFVDGKTIKLKKGDRFNVPVRKEHTAKVGEKGCSFIVGEMIKGDS